MSFVRRRRQHCSSPSVLLPCIHEWYPTEDLSMLDISEGPQGEDTMVYECPECGKQHASVVVMR